ncbi:MAG: hypothetical protein NTV79_01710 [Candidatus Aureabacteria bacterium]|nr:hypothetical protein [Candidatus Auribacterota bacterium]
MNKLAVLCAIGMACLAATLFAQGQEPVAKVISDFQAALAGGDFVLAQSFLSPAMIQKIASVASAPAVAQEEGEDFLHLDTATFLKKELSGGPHDPWEVASINQEGNLAAAELKLGSWKLVKLTLARNSSGAWKITASPDDVFRDEQKQDDAQIKSIQQQEQKMESEQKRDQDIADDVNEDRGR